MLKVDENGLLFCDLLCYNGGFTILSFLIQPRNLHDGYIQDSASEHRENSLTGHKTHNVEEEEKVMV